MTLPDRFSTSSIEFAALANQFKFRETLARARLGHHALTWIAPIDRRASWSVVARCQAIVLRQVDEI
jgi:hypothetical protein